MEIKIKSMFQIDLIKKIDPNKAKNDDDEKEFSKPTRSIYINEQLNFESKKAWELANLTRIAYQDYECFDNFENQIENGESREFTLEEDRTIDGVSSNNSFIYTSNKIEDSIIDKYFLSDRELDSNDEQLTSRFDEGYVQYKILKTYEYTAFYPINLDVQVDRFGFIAERKQGDQTNIFVVFRGTKELAEWYSNAQFAQVNFLQTENQPEGIHSEIAQEQKRELGNISLGFNKIYTEFRPGIFTNKAFQKLLKTADEFKSKRALIKEQSISEAIKEFFFSDYFKNKKNQNANIYITGHSLGGALATIAAMDIAVIDLAREDIIKKSDSSLYFCFS